MSLDEVRIPSMSIMPSCNTFFNEIKAQLVKYCTSHDRRVSEVSPSNVSKRSETGSIKLNSSKIHEVNLPNSLIASITCSGNNGVYRGKGKRMVPRIRLQDLNCCSEIALQEFVEIQVGSEPADEE